MRRSGNRYGGWLGGGAGRLIAALAVGATVTAAATAQELTLDEVITRLIAEDPEVERSALDVERSLNEYQLTLAGVRPDLSLEVAPYRYDTRRIEDFDGPRRISTVSAALGLSLTQPLPTSGVVNASLSNEFAVQRGGGQVVEQRPEASLALSQPLFANGGVINTEAFRASLRLAEIGFELATTGDLVARNGAVEAVASLYIQVDRLRRSVALLESTIDVVGRQLEAARVDREQGLISDNALLALQVTLNDRREALFDTRLALVETEQALARSLGERELGDAVLSSAFPALPPLPDEAAALERGNPRLASGRLNVERATRRAAVNDLTDRPSLAVTVRAAPLYPATRENVADVAASVTDLLQSDAGVEATLSLDLTVPLLTARERSARRRIDEIGASQASLSLSDSERAVRNSLTTLRVQREFLEQRLEIVALEVDLEQRRVATEESLLESGATTALRVDEVRLDLQARRDERRQIEAELFLNALEILALAGIDLAEAISGGA